MDEYQNFTCYRLNPNQQELDKEVDLERNVDGRSFSSCKLEITDHTAVLTDEDGVIRVVLSLHHFYLINTIR